jgi:hypothetical protein
MNMRMIKRMAALLPAVAATLMVAAGPVGATVDLTPASPVPVEAGATSVPLTVKWSGLPVGDPNGRRIFITQCKKIPSDPTFVFAIDCSNISEVTLNPDQNVGGHGQTTEFSAFHGTEPTGDESWGCFAPGETPPAGITAITTCYVRVTQDSEQNTSDQQFTPLSFTIAPPAVTPEVSNAILLPVTAAVIIAGAGFGLSRRRRSVAAA